MKNWLKKLGATLVPLVFLQSLVLPTGFPASAAGTAALSSISRGAWKATASVTVSGSNASNAIDNDVSVSTRWTTGIGIKAGQWFQVDMGVQTTFNTIVINDGAGGSNGADFAAAYDILVSNDGTNWSSPVVSAAGAAYVTVISLPEQTARYFKIVVSNPTSSGWWSIYDLRVMNLIGDNTTDIALGRTASASTVDPANPANTAARATDGNASTLWSAGAGVSSGWVTVDLGTVCQVTGANLDWGDAYASSYQVQISADNSTFTTLYSGSSSASGAQQLSFFGIGRYIRMNATAAGTANGIQLKTFSVYGGKNLASNTTGAQGIASFTSTGTRTTYLNDNIISYSSGSPLNRWSNSGSANTSDWAGVDFGKPVSVNEAVFGLYYDGGTALPTSVNVQYYSGGTWVDAPNQTPATLGSIEGPNIIRFSSVSASKIRLNMTPTTGKSMAVTELEVYGPDVSASFTTTLGDGNALTAAVQNAVIGNTYQMWAYQKLPADVTGQATDQYIWVPMKDNGNGTFTLAEATADANGNYRVSMIETDASGNVVSKSFDSPASLPTNAVRIEKILAGGKVCTGRETVNLDDSAQATQNIQIVADNATGYTLTYGTADNQTSVSPDSSGNTFPVSFAGLGIGTYTFTATAIGASGQKDTRVLTFNTYSTAGAAHATPVISGMTGSFTGNTLGLTLTGKDTANNILQIGDGFLYRFRAGEPGRGISYSASSVSGPTGSVPVPVGKYGTYQVYATAAYGSSVAYDDAAMGYYDYTRPGGAVMVSSYTVKENGGADSSATDQTGTTGKTYSFNATADVSKLTGGETARYSFWRCDASGWVLLKDWSPDATLSWTPAYAGKYIIQVRVQGSKAGSYESARNMTFDVASSTGLVTAKNVSLTLTATGNKARQPVTLTTAATPSAGLLYRYEVQDPTLGLTLLNAYSPDNTFTWVPRKAGNYTVYMQVINQNSFGMYDAQTSQPVTIGN